MENVYSTEWDSTQEKEGYRWHRIRLARRLGGEKLGASIFVIEPGQKSFPYHFHHSNEEMLLVLEGTVSVRSPEGNTDAGPGDALIFNTGPDGAHQLINNSDENARVIMFSTMLEPEIAQYPDSGNIGLFAGAVPGMASEPLLAKWVDGSAEVDYFEGK